VAQTINIANIKIGMDVDELKKSGQFTRNELASLTRTIKASEAPFQRMAKDVALLDRAFATGAMDTATYNAAIDQLSKKHGVAAIYADKAAAAEARLAKAKADSMAALSRQQIVSEIPDPFKGWGSVDSVTQQTNGLAASLRNVGAAGLAISATKGIFDFGKSAVNVSMMREQVQAQLEVLTGSAEAAKKLIAATVELDQKSALSASQFQDSAKVMLGYGMSVGEITPMLNRLSEISMGNNEKMQSLTLAFSQVRANGRLMGQEVLQMVNAGFNPLQEISRTTGESMVNLRKRMEEGKVSFEEVAKAAQTATEQGGRFYGMNDKMADTTAVKIAKLQTHWQNLLAREGAMMQPGINNALDLINKNIDQMPKRGEAINGWWMTLTGRANEYYKQLDEINATKKLAEELDKKAADAEAQKAKLAKDRAAAEEQAAKAQQAAIDADNKRIESERSAFQNRIKQISEERTKASFGGDEQKFKKSQLIDNTFGMTQGEIQQAKAAMIEMDETRRLNELNAAHAAIEAANKELEIQKQVALMKEKNFLASDSLRKEYAQLDEMFRRQLSDSNATEEQKAGIRKRAALAEQSIFARSEFEMMQQRKEKQQQRVGSPTADAVANIAPSIKAGTVEAFKFLQQSQTKQKELQEQVELQKKILKEAEIANRLAETAPRLAFAR